MTWACLKLLSLWFISGPRNRISDIKDTNYWVAAAPHSISTLSWRGLWCWVLIGKAAWLNKPQGQKNKQKKKLLYCLAGNETKVSYCLLAPWLYNTMFRFFVTRHVIYLPMASDINLFFFFIFISGNWGPEKSNLQTLLPGSPLEHTL